MSGENLHELCTQPLELILLDQFVKVGGKELEHQTQVVTVDERIPQPQDVMFVVRIVLVVQLPESSEGVN